MIKKRKIGLLTIISVFLFGLLDSVLIEFNLSLESNIETNNFWLRFIGFVLLFSIILYFVIHTKYFYPKYLDIRSQQWTTKLVSGDLFIVFFFFGFLVFGLPIYFRSPVDAIRNSYEFYSYYFVLGFFYLFIMKSMTIIDIIRSDEEFESKSHLFVISDRNAIIEIAFGACSAWLIFYCLHFAFPKSMIASIFKSSEVDYLLFIVFCNSPVEELVFRGAFYFLFYQVFRAIVFWIKKTPKDERSSNVNVEIISNYFAIIFSSITFSAYHLNAYGYNFWTLIQILLFSFFLGILQYKYSILAPVIVHSLNNIGSFFNASVNGNGIPLNYSLIIVILVLCAIIIGKIMFEDEAKMIESIDK